MDFSFRRWFFRDSQCEPFNISSASASH